MNMGRWLVELSGKRHDLEQYSRGFPDGDVFCIEERGNFFLVGQELEKLASAEMVLRAAVTTLDRLSAVIAILQPGSRVPTATRVIREEESGRRSGIVPLSGTISVRSAAWGTLTIAGVPTQPQQPTLAQEILRRTAGSPHVETALSMWRDSMRSWSSLYRILEELERHLGETVSRAGLCSASQRKRFTRTANTAEVAGADARHAAGKFPVPTNPMNLVEAQAFVRQMIRRVVVIDSFAPR